MVLTGREARARDAQRAGALEDLDRRAHRGLELVDGGRGLVRRVDGLLVADHRQPEDAVALAHRRVERAQVDPQVVRVDVAVAADVLQRLEVLLGRLRGLAQHEPAVLAPAREVAALAVGLRAVGDLHQRTGSAPRAARRGCAARARRRGCRSWPRTRTRSRARAARSSMPGGDERGVEVAVAGRAPLERRVVGPLDRRQVVDAELRLLVLQEVERQADVEVRVRGQRLERVLARGEGVHQHERQPRVVALAQREHLAGDDVEEAAARPWPPAATWRRSGPCSCRGRR